MSDEIWGQCKDKYSIGATIECLVLILFVLQKYSKVICRYNGIVVPIKVEIDTATKIDKLSAE